MARVTPKKKGTATSSGGSILSFFQKTPSGANCRPGLASVNHSDILIKSEDRDNDCLSPNARDSVLVPTKKLASLGSIADPVVISDDEDAPRSSTNGLKRRRLSPVAGPVEHKSINNGSPPIAGPSRSPLRTCSPPPLPLQEKPNPFPGLPGFQQPPTWPEIVNTADLAENEEDDSDVPPSDPERGREDDAWTQDAGDDGEDPGGNDSGLDVEMETQPIVRPLMEPRSRSPPKQVGAVSTEIAMDWADDQEEGMGMEDFADDEGDGDASEIVETPPLALRGPLGANMTECPVCGKSLRGKPDKAVQLHINSCLDTRSTSTRKAHRPISSFGQNFSPAKSHSPPPEPPTKGPNAFSLLMSGHKEREEWKDAEIDLKRDGKRIVGRRKAPFYRVMTGMPVAVDAFRYGAVPKVTAYLLTHAHSDHYTNLSKSWNHGPIYCSETTANLIIHMLGVEPKWVHGLPNDVPFEMPNTGGVVVTVLEANHCPGSSLFMFEGRQTVNAGDSSIRSPYVGSKRVFRYLHCGDFRACPKHVLHPAVARGKIDTCYLDTTYLNPKYCFPPQPQVIDACAALARKTALGISPDAPALHELKPYLPAGGKYGVQEDVKPDLDEYGDVEDTEDPNADIKPDIKPDIDISDPFAAEIAREERSKAMMQGWLVKKESGEDVKEELREVGDSKPKGRTLVVMGTYSIGKERIVKAVARALGTKIYCDPRKKGILLCQTDPELHAMIGTDPFQCQVHLLPLGNIQLERLQPYLQSLRASFDRVLGFRPTGWAYSPPAGTDLLPDVNTVIRRDQSRTFTEAGLKPMRGSCRQFMMYGVPYSEHSSFFELTCFALSMPGPDLRMIATVNVGNEKSRAKMKKWFEKWSAEKVKRKEKGMPAIVDYRDETYW